MGELVGVGRLSRRELEIMERRREGREGGREKRCFLYVGASWGSEQLTEGGGSGGGGGGGGAGAATWGSLTGGPRVACRF